MIRTLRRSGLGHILFLIFINDLAYCSNFKTAKYADDIFLALSHKNTGVLEENLNQELCKVNNWLKINPLSSNTAKAKFWLFHQTKNDIYTSLSMITNGSEIDRSYGVK